MSITKNNTRMLEGEDLTLTGSLGVGTPSPSTYSGQLVNFKDSGAGTYLGHANSGTFPKVSAIGMGSDAVSLTHTSGGASFTLTGSVQIAAIQSTDAGAPTDLAFYTNNSGTVTERLRIKGDGTVIINNIPTSSTSLPSGAIYSDGGTLKIV